MMLTLTREDFNGLSATTRAELISLLEPAALNEEPAKVPDDMDASLANEFPWNEVADLTAKQVQVWMERASEKTKSGLKVMAEHGPVVDAHKLLDAGIENLSHFQSRTTIRTRTVTSDDSAFLFTWDDWREYPDGIGRYAVTPITHQSLKKYFGMA